MSNKVQDALKAATETKDLRMGHNVLKDIPTLFNKYFEGHKAIIIADKTTYQVAGEQIYNLLNDNNIEQDKPFIFNSSNLYAEYNYVAELSNFLSKTDAIPLAVGSGTINDITKLASSENNKLYMCIATAASMDGYTAFGASITADGAKQTFNCPAPTVCVADIDIISKAPQDMTASGYADLFAKITAGADWILADRLNVEPIDKQAWSIVQDGLHEALSNPIETKEGAPHAIEQLTSGLMLGGFAMQWSKSSRPASGAEHQFSHLWNMEHHTNNGEQISHGFQVAIGTLAITALYEEILKYPFEELDIESCCNNWPTLEELEKDAIELFKNTDFPEIGAQETKAKYINKQELSEQLQLLKNNWESIKAEIKAQIVPFKEAQERLKLVGAPYEPEQLAISRKYLKETFHRAQYIRRRFTVLDLIVRTNTENYFMEKLFGNGQVWDINKD